MTTRIIGTGRGLPTHQVTNDHLSTVMDTSDEWIYSRTGIHERRLVENETTTSMAVEAAKNAMEDAGINPEEIELILVGTVSPDMCFPTVSCMVQAEIGAVNAVAYDLSAGCSGFLFALNTAHAYIAAGIYKCALIIGAETLSKIINWEDRSTCVLFGDGAGAAIVKEDKEGMIRFHQQSDGRGGDALYCENRKNNNIFVQNPKDLDYIHMNGQEVFKFAVKTVPESIIKVLEEANMTVDEIDHFIFHQANKRIIQSAAKRLNVPIEKFPMNMEYYGNTSAATIPILLDELKKDGVLKRGDKLILAGFGAGLTWGVALMTW